MYNTQMCLLMEVLTKNVYLSLMHLFKYIWGIKQACKWLLDLQDIAIKYTENHIWK